MREVSYKESGTPGEITKTVAEENVINLAEFVGRYKELEARYKDIPKVKLEPDNQTLDFWNSEIPAIADMEMNAIIRGARVLYRELNAIRIAGLLEEKYEDEFLKLQNFVNNAGNI